jgi:hypothetical protein
MGFDVHSYFSHFGFQRIKTQGENLMASCFDPYGLHPQGDKRQSFGVHMHTGLANCYVCGGWTIEQLTALLLTEQSKRMGKPRLLTEYDAWKWLEKRNWIPEYTPEDFMKALKRAEARKEIPTYPMEALQPYLRRIHKSLLTPQEPNERYFSPEIVRKWMIGFCDVSRRIVVPVFDSMDRFRGVISRATHPDDYIRYGVGTYKQDVLINEGKREMGLTLEKGTVLFGEGHFRGHDTLLLVESPLDVVWADMCGITDSTDVGAMFGASLTQEQERVARQYKRVVLGFDNDEAGTQGKIAATKRLMGFVQVYTFDNYDKKDLGQLTMEQVRGYESRLKSETFSQFSGLKPME